MERPTRAPKVEFFKSGDTMGIRTTATTYEDFTREASDQLARLIDAGNFSGDWEFQLGYWLPQLFELAAKLKGYKADVYEERVIYAGDPFIADDHLVRPDLSPSDAALATAVARQVDADLRAAAADAPTF